VALPFASLWVYACLVIKSEPILALSRFAGFVLNIVLPPQDPFETKESGWQSVRFLAEPQCACCGFPFEYDVGVDALCANCIATSPKYNSARAAMIYDDASRPFILSFKHGGKTENLSRFAAQLRRAGGDMLRSADYLVPVPLHNSRRFKRRFNQSVLLGRALSKITKVPLAPNVLRRVKATASQGGQSAAGRRRNVQGAFAVTDTGKGVIKGCHIVLIDDVMTTGATVEACALQLLRTGAKRVDVLCLARVIRPTIEQTERANGQS